MEELDGYLDGIDFLGLTEEAKECLDSPITLKEVQQALGSLQVGKTPGAERLPTEFYKQYSEQILSRLHKVMAKALDGGVLLASVAEAIIVVIPKPGKNPELCTSYRPISLLNVDFKILTKVLASRVNDVILTLIHEDQTGFMPGKGTDINLRRLYTVLAASDHLTPSDLVASIDAEKAFDSVEWVYLWEVLCRFGFGFNFISWVRALYSFPRARIRTGSTISPPFLLHRGMRQGCPLSLTLFALAIEPMAILLRSSEALDGIPIGPVQVRISLYTDDTSS